MTQGTARLQLSRTQLEHRSLLMRRNVMSGAVHWPLASNHKYNRAGVCRCLGPYE